MKKAGFENKEGRYEFVCPNCGTNCVAEWVNFMVEQGVLNVKLELEFK